MTDKFDFSLRNLARVLAASALLGGCSGWFGTNDDVILEGERVSIRERPNYVPLITDGGSVNLPNSVDNAEWPQNNGNGARYSGHLAGGFSYNSIWSTNIGTGSSAASRIVSPPIVVGGQVIALDAASRITAVDTANGTVRWQASLVPSGEKGEDGFGGGLASDSGVVFVTTGFGTVSALDAASGGLLWETPLGVPMRAAPAYSEGRVFAVTRDNQVFALDAQTGEKIWNDQGLEVSAGFLGGAAPAVRDDIVAVPFSSGELVAYTADGGARGWIEQVGGLDNVGGLGLISDVSGDPVIADGVVYASSASGSLTAIDAVSGSRLWTRDVGSTDPVWAVGNALFMVASNGAVIAMNREDGTAFWSNQLNSEREAFETATVWAGPVVAGGDVIAVSSRGQLLALNAADGSVKADVPLGTGSSVPPVIAGGALYVLLDSGQLVAFR